MDEGGGDYDYEYLDEVLPAITIRDLLTPDEMVERDPGFLAFNEEQVTEYIHDFFPDAAKARGFAKLWQRAVAPPPPVPPTFIPIVGIQRAATQTPNFLEQWERILSIPNVGQRKRELDKLFFPYTPSDNAATADDAAAPPATASITAAAAAPADLRPPVEVSSAVGEPFKLTRTDAEDDLIATRFPIIGAVENTWVDPEPILFNAAERRAWRTVIQGLEHRRRARDIAALRDETWTDIDALKASLEDMRTPFDELTQGEAEELMKSAWPPAPPRRAASASSDATTHATHAKRPESHGAVPASLWKAIARALESVAPEVRTPETSGQLQPAIVARLERLLAAFEETHALVPELPEPLTPVALADALEHADDITLGRMVEAYRLQLRQEERKQARAAMSAAIEALRRADEWETTLEQNEAQFLRTLSSIKHSVMGASARFPAYADEKQAKAGDDISGYVGTLAAEMDLAGPAAAPAAPGAPGAPDNETEGALTAAVEDAAAATLDATLRAPATSHSGPESAADRVAEVTEGDANAPLNAIAAPLLEGATAGQREVLMLVVPLLQGTATITGLPIDAGLLASFVAPHIARNSRLAQLRELIGEGMEDSENTDDELQALLNDPSMAEWYLAPERKKAVQRALTTVAAEFDAAIVDALSRMLAAWAVQLQETFADRRLLDYKPPANMTECAALWGLHGPPMSNTKGRGVLMYLMCALRAVPGDYSNITASFLEGASAEDRAAQVGALAEAMFPGRVTALRAAYQELMPVLKAQAVALKAEQDEWKAFLQGDGTVARYVAGLLQLPRIVAMNQSTLRKGTRGCCAQTLGEQYRAYADWTDNRLLRGLLKQMRELGKKPPAQKVAPTGMKMVGITGIGSKHSGAKHASNASTSGDGSCVKAPEVVPEAPPAPVGYAELQEAWRRWLPENPALDVPKFVKERLEAVARAVGQPKAFATWMPALDRANMDELCALALSVGKAAPEPMVLEGGRALAAARALRIAEADEQRVLDMVRFMILSWCSRAVTGARAPKDTKAAIAAAFADFAATMPTPAQLNDKISELRERQKAAVLNKLNSKDPEMRKLLTDMSRLGVIRLAADDGAGGAAAGGLEPIAEEGHEAEPEDPEASPEGSPLVARGEDYDAPEDEFGDI